MKTTVLYVFLRDYLNFELKINTSTMSHVLKIVYIVGNDMSVKLYKLIYFPVVELLSSQIITVSNMKILQIVHKT
jgi:hypothetical protein